MQLTDDENKVLVEAEEIAALENQINDMEADIKQLIVALDALTPEHSNGEEWLKKIKQKYSSRKTRFVCCCCGYDIKKQLGTIDAKWFYLNNRYLCRECAKEIGQICIDEV